MKNNTKYYIVLLSFAIVIIFYVIVSDDGQIPVVKYKINKIIEKAQDDSIGFWYEPQSLMFCENKILITDYGNNRVTILDSSLKNLISFGKKGKGPGEFQNPVFAFLKHNKVYVSDYGNKRIQIFNFRGDFIKTFPAPPGLSPTSNFLVSDSGTIFQPELSYDNPTLYAEYTDKGEIINRFGKKIEYTDPITRRVKNNFRFDQDEQGNIYVVFWEEPIIRKYDVNGKLLWEKDTRIIKSVRKRLDEINKLKMDETEKNTSHSLAIYSTIFKKNLYVYYSTSTHGEIFVFDTYNGDLLHQVNILGTQDRDPKLYQHSFSFVNNKLYFLDYISNCLVECEQI